MPILHGPSPLRLLSKDSFGKQLHEGLLQNINLPCAMVDAVTNRKLSFKEIFDKSRRLVLSLQKYVTRNDVIAICSENSLDYIYPIVAAMYLGITVTTINPMYTTREILHYTSISKPVMMFCSTATLKVAREAGKQMEYLKQIVLMDTKDKFDDFQSIEDLTSGYSEKQLENVVPVTVDPSEQVAFILYSSGTTGLPKGVLITHKNVNASLYVHRDSRFYEQFKPGMNIGLCVLPFCHVYGFFFMLASLILGKKLVVLKKFELTAYLKAIQDHKVRELYIVPALANILVTSPLIDEYDLSTVEMVICGGAPLSKDKEEAIKKRLKLRVFTQGYGLTEVTLTVMLMPLGENKTGSCGKLLPYISAKVIDAVSGIPLGPEQNGELCFKGEFIMKGYKDNPNATKESIDEDGWLHTGDVGYYDKNGFFFVVDRLKELIKYKGCQVAPAELEALLLSHPQIKDAGVIGFPDEIAGELPLAFVVKKPNANISAAEIIDFVARQVSSQKQLRGGVRFIKEIPKTATNKILRRKLRELL